MRVQLGNLPKSLSEAELRSYLDWIRQQIQGAQLQDVRTDGRILVLELYGKGPWFLVLIPEAARPHLFLMSGDQDLNLAKTPKPVQLFLKSHGKNLALGEVHLNPEMGRQIELLFLNRHKEVRVIFDLIPHFTNIQVFAEGKAIAWSKPKPAPVKPEQELARVEQIQDWSSWSQQFFREQTKAGSSAKSSASEDLLQKTLGKKQGALQKLQESLHSPEAARWQAFGESLKIAGTPLDLYADLLEDQLSLAENREKAFQKAKDLKRKKQGTLERIQILEKEILQLKTQGLPSPEAGGKKQGTQALVKSGSRGQTLNLASGAQAIVGKSALDNMAILRQAKAWDLWLHLKDEPSAHAVIFRQKNQKIPEGDLQQVAQWLLAKSKLGKESRRSFRFEVLVVECRFVKPIKGDKAGRVTYTNPQVYSFASKPNP